MSEEAVGRRRVFSWAACASLVGFLWTRVASADSKGSGPDNGGAAFGEKVAGTYFLKVSHEGFPTALALVTLTRDGAFLSNDTSDQGALGLTHDGAVGLEELPLGILVEGSGVLLLIGDIGGGSRRHHQALAREGHVTP